MNYISENIKAFRKAWNLSQQEMSFRLGVSRNVLANWERGRSVPGREAAAALSRLSGVSASDITSQVLSAAQIGDTPAGSFVSADMIAGRLEHIEALLTDIANKLDKSTGVKD